MITGKHLIYPLLFLWATLCMAQQVTVLDAEKRPVSFAHVNVRPISHSSSLRLITNEAGKCSIPANMFHAQSTLLINIRHLGFKTMSDTLNPGENRTYMLEPSEMTINPVVVTAQYEPGDPEKAVHKIRVIDRPTIRSMGAVTLQDVLRHEVNIRLTQDNILGSQTHMQGISGQHVKILVDGLPVIGRLDGNIDVSQLNLNTIERIEIVEGPLSVNYGTDALAGTINLITDKEQKEKFSVSLNSYYETVGQYNLDGQTGWNLGNHQFKLSGGRHYFDGWSPTDDFIELLGPRPADTNRSQSWNTKKQYFGKLLYNLQWRNLKFRPYIEYFNEQITNLGFPREPYHETAFDDTYSTRRQNVGMDASLSLSNDKKISLQAAYNGYRRIKNTYFTDLTTLDQQFTDDPADHDTSTYTLWMSRGGFSTTLAQSALNYEIGYDISYETAYGQRIEDLEKQQGNYALLTTAEWRPVDQLTIRPGIRITYNTAYDAPVVPSLNMRFKAGMLTFRGSYARGFRAPSLKELYFEFVDVNHNIHGYDRLKAEQSDNYHVHINWQRLRATSNIKLETGAFYNDIRNLITLAQTPSGPAYTYVNIGTYKTVGLRGKGELVRRQISISLNGAYVGRYNVVSEEFPVTAFSYSPEISTNMSYTFPNRDANLALFYKYTGKQPGFSTNANDEIIKTTISDYHTLDITFTKPFWDRRISLTVGGKNLFDVSNINAVGSGGGAHSTNTGSVPVNWGRTFFTSLKFNFSKP